MISFTLVFSTLALTVGANLPSGILDRLGLSPGVLLVALAVFALAGLLVHRPLALVVLVGALALGANVPPEVAATFGYEPGYLVATLIAVASAPLAGVGSAPT